MHEQKKVHAKKKPMTVNDKHDGLEIYVQDVSHNKSVPRPGRLKAWVQSAFEQGRYGELTVRIVDEREGAALNERFRQGEGATNVLAFPADDLQLPTTAEPPAVGDIVICAPVLEREAVAQNRPLDAHWAHIAIHGALHLVGFDHMDEASAAVMEAREAELLESLGFDNPYAGDG